MRNLKMFRAGVLITLLSIIVGCSDQISSLGEPVGSTQNESITPQVSSQIDRPIYRERFKLKPKRSISLNKANTGLENIVSVDVTKVNKEVSPGIVADPCADIQVSSNSVDKYDLSCHSRDFLLGEIMITNTGTSMFEADVVLTSQKTPTSSAEVK